MLKLLIALELCMVILYLLDHRFYAFGRTHHLIDLDQESTVPSWFSSVQLFLIGILFLLQKFRYPLPKNDSLNFLSFIGLCLIFLSMDEAISIHERVSWTFNHIEWLPRFKGDYGLWIPIYVVAGLTLLAVLQKNILKIWRFYPKESVLFTLGFLIVLAGGVGLEIISYQYLRNVDELNNLYLLEVAVEEGLEMIGASVMLYAAVLFTIEGD